MVFPPNQNNFGTHFAVSKIEQWPDHCLSFMKREKTMRLFRNLMITGAFALLFLGVPAIASAQYGQYDPYGRNGGYDNGRYGNNGDMRSTLRDLKSRSRQLERQIDRELDRGRYNGSSREDQVNDLASRFKDAVNDLDSSYYNRNDNEGRRVMQTASQLDRAISRTGLSYNVMNQWSAIRNDLQTLGIGYNNRGRVNRGRGNNSGGYNQPSWWPF